MDRCTNRECTICYPNGFVRPAEREDLQGAVWFIAICVAVAALLAGMVLSGCAAQVTEPDPCPVHAIPAFTCDPPLPMQCIFSPNVIERDGACLVDVFTGCQNNGNLVHIELPYRDGAVSMPGQFYGSTCSFEVAR